MRCLYRFIGPKMRYNTNIQKICLENMFDKLQTGHITGRMDLMWNTEDSRRVALAEGRCVETEETEDRHSGRQKLSSGMAMVLGALLTIEIMIGGAMLFNFDFKGADIVAVVLAFMVLYFAVVASLTDK